MAESGRKSLVWDIRKSLLTLSAESSTRSPRMWVQQQVRISQSSTRKTRKAASNTSALLCTVRKLLEAEDSGMVDLLMLNDFIEEVIKNRPEQSIRDDSEDVDSHTTLTVPVTTTANRTKRAQPTREGLISLRDLSYLQRREFKVQGGQVGDHSSDISYNNICEQMDEGTRESFSEAEIVCGVLRIIKPGTVKDNANQ